MIRNYVNLFLLSLSLFQFSGCSENKKESGDQNTQIKQAFLDDIKTVTTAYHNMREDLMLTGKVDYDPERVVSYVPLISGIVERTYFNLGDKVQKGQALLDIRSMELSEMQTELIAREGEFKIAEREWITARSMYQDGMFSEKDLLEAETKKEQAIAALNKAKSDLLVYGTINQDGTFRITSPMSGYVVDKKVVTGSHVSSDAEALFVIADLSHVWVIANVYAGNLMFVREGMEVEIMAYSYPEDKMNARINALSQVFDPEEKVLKARIFVDNKDLRFKPEMSVTVKLKNETGNSLIAIPGDALVFDDDRYFVVLEESEGVFAYREVTRAGHHGSTTYISAGLSENERVVVRNQLLIYSDLKDR